MILQQIWEGVQAFFAAAGVMAVLLIVIAWVGISVEERRLKKAERAKRERNWDWQEKRIDRLSEQLDRIRADWRESVQVMNNHADEIERHEATLDAAATVAELMANKLLGLEHAHDHTRQTVLNLQGRYAELDASRENQQAINGVVYERLNQLDNNLSLIAQAAEKSALGGLVLAEAGEKLEARVVTLEKNDKDHDYWEESTDRQLNSIEDDISDLQIDVANLQAEKEAA